jgi:Na+/H+ antiporter NhaC
VFLLGLLSFLDTPARNLPAVHAKKHLPGLVKELQAQIRLPKVVSIYVSTPAAEDFNHKIRDQLMSALKVKHHPNLKERLLYTTITQDRNYTAVLTYYPDGAQPVSVWKKGHMFLWESVSVPLLAISLALLFKQVLVALGLAIILGAFVFHSFAFVPALETIFKTYLWGTISDTSHLFIYGFTIFLLAMVGVMVGSGGIGALLKRMTLLAKSARATKLTAFFMGLVIFFDDYANTLVVGGSMRSLFRKAKVSKAKLAYIIDSTAAPVAGLAIFSTWVVYEISQLDATFAANFLTYDGFLTFLSAFVFRFYCWFTLIFVFFNIWKGKDFGPMLASERDAYNGKLDLTQDDPDDTSHKASSMWIAILPLAWVIFGLPIALVWDGMQTAIDPSLSFAGWFRTALGNADSAKVLMGISAGGFFLSCIVALLTKAQNLKGVGQSAWKGTLSVMPALVILTLAWAIQAACADVQIASYLMALIGPNMSAFWIAPVVFLTASAISFATGTSFGTMALMIPLAIPLAIGVGNELTLLLVTAAVLDGAIFGDHCSPISETTVMSSIASSCDHMEHVNTQLPYAITTMLIALCIGYIPASMGAPFWAMWVMGAATIWLVIKWFGRPVTSTVVDSGLTKFLRRIFSPFRGGSSAG